MSFVSELIADAWRHFNAGDYAHAAELVQHGLAEDSDHGPLWQLRGLLQHAQGDMSVAHALVARAKQSRSDMQPKMTGMPNVRMHIGRRPGKAFGSARLAP